jgi:glutamyl-tRNA reductase
MDKGKLLQTCNRVDIFIDVAWFLVTALTASCRKVEVYASCCLQNQPPLHAHSSVEITTDNG